MDWRVVRVGMGSSSALLAWLTAAGGDQMLTLTGAVAVALHCIGRIRRAGLVRLGRAALPPLSLETRTVVMRSKPVPAVHLVRWRGTDEVADQPPTNV